MSADEPDLEPCDLSELGEMPDVVRTAASVACQGQPVLAIRPGSKAPVHAGSEQPNHRDHWLTTPEQVVTAWLENDDERTGERGCQFAVMTGQSILDAGWVLVCLDADVDGRWSLLDDLLRQAGDDAVAWAAATLRVQHDDGRAHLWGLVPVGQCPPTGDLVEHIEWRGNSGYVLLAGARHPSGTRYRVTRSAPALPVPESLLRLVRSKLNTPPLRVDPQLARVNDMDDGRPGVASAYDRLLDALRAAGKQVWIKSPSTAIASCPGPAHAKGDRRPGLSIRAVPGKTMVKCHRDGCETTDVLAALGLTMRDLFDDFDVESVTIDSLSPASVPPTPAATIEAPGIRLPLRPTVVATRLRDLAEMEEARLQHDASRTELSVWQGVSGDLFDPDTPEPVPCVLEFAPGRFVFAPGRVFLFGVPESMKTWLMYLAMKQELARGNLVLLIDYELSFEIAMRRMLTLGTPHEHLAGLTYVQPDGLAGVEGRAVLLRQFQDRPPSLVVNDSVGEGLGQAGLDENLSKDVIKFSADLVLPLARAWPESVIGLIDHVPKGSYGAKAPIGSQRKLAMAEQHFRVDLLESISRNTRGSGRVISTKSRAGYADDGEDIFDFAFGGGGPFEIGPPDVKKAGVDLSRFPGADDGGAALAHWRHEVMAKVGAAGKLSRTDITGHGTNGGVLRAALNSLIGEGVLREQQEGRFQMVRLAD